MKITILTYGSRGDVQPFVALARGLQKNGHEIKLAAPHRFGDFVNSYSVPFIPLAGDPEEISKRINDAGTNAVRVMSSIWDYIFAIAPKVSRSAFEACGGAELIIHSFLFTVGGHSWAREHCVPDISVQTFPMFAPTREFPNVAASQLPAGSLSYLSHWIAAQAFWHGGNTGYGPARRSNPDIDYPKKLYWPFDSRPPRLRTPLLFAYSPSILPRPGDWDENVHVTGYFFLDDDNFQPPDVLKDFLFSDKAPVCVSFGSMVNRDAKRVMHTVMDAINITDNRAIFLTGWNGFKPEDIPDTMLFLDAIPHHWLFPYCKVIIHHGGAGTTGAGLRAGIPNIVVPHTADQPFWGRCIHEIGAGPKPVLVKNLSVENLVRAIVEAESKAVRERAQAIGQRIRGEDGVRQAAALIESHVSNYKDPRFFKV
jgi:sterol 3beta-glucosyltransferase